MNDSIYDKIQRQIYFDPTDAEESLLPDGQHAAVVVSVSHGTSKRGNPKLHVVVRVDWEDHKYFVHDHIALTRPMIRRFRQLCQAVGVDFYSPPLALDSFTDKSVLIVVKVESDPTGEFPQQNRITLYRPLDNEAGA